MSENEFLSSLKEEMPEAFGHKLLAELNAEEKIKPMPQTALWTVAAACIVTVLVGIILFISRQPNSHELNITQNLWTQREPITPENISQLQPLLTLGDGFAVAIALSPDDNTLAVATSTGIYLHDAHDLNAAPRSLGTPVENISNGYQDGYIYLEYTEDGRLFALYNYQGKVELYQWDDSTSSFITVYQPTFAMNRYVQSVDISPDGTKLLLGVCAAELAYPMFSYPSNLYCMDSLATWIWIIDLTSQETLFELMPIITQNAIATVNPDWTILAYQDKRQVYLMNLETGETKAIFNLFHNASSPTPQEEFIRPYFSPDGEYLGMSNYDRKPIWMPLADLWRTEQATELSEQFWGYYNQSLTVNPATEEYILGWQSGFQIHDYRGERASQNVVSDVSPISLILSSDGQRLYGLGDSGLIRTWDMNSLESVDSYASYSLGRSISFSVSPDSQRLMTLGHEYSNQLGYQWELGENNFERTVLASGDERYLPTSYAAYSPDGRYLAYYQDNTIWLYDNSTQFRRRIIYSSGNPLLAFREDGALVTLRTSNLNSQIQGTIYTYSPESLASDVPVPLPAVALEGLQYPDRGIYTQTEGVNYTLSADARTLVVYQCEFDSSVTIAPPPCLDISFTVYDTETGHLLRHLESGINEDGRFRGFSISQDSQWLAIYYCSDITTDGWGCEEGSSQLGLWNISEIREISDIPLSAVFKVSNVPAIPYVDFSLIPYADGSFLLDAYEIIRDEADMDNYHVAIQFWHLVPNGEMEMLKEIEAESASFAPDRSYILTSNNGRIQLWGVPASLVSAQE